MVNFLIFKNIYFNLGDDCRNKILGNIFKIDNVSISSIIVDNDKIIFRIFGGAVFYQYVFILGIGVNEVVNNNQIINYKVFVDNENMMIVNKFIDCLIRCQNEYQVYLLLRQYL